jgi:hypothetical protein
VTYSTYSTYIQRGWGQLPSPTFEVEASTTEPDDSSVRKVEHPIHDDLASLTEHSLLNHSLLSGAVQIAIHLLPGYEVCEINLSSV